MGGHSITGLSCGKKLLLNFAIIAPSWIHTCDPWRAIYQLRDITQRLWLLDHHGRFSPLLNFIKNFYAFVISDFSVGSKRIRKEYTFDKVFDEVSTQEAVFEEVDDLVQVWVESRQVYCLTIWLALDQWKTARRQNCGGKTWRIAVTWAHSLDHLYSKGLLQWAFDYCTCVF